MTDITTTVPVNGSVSPVLAHKPVVITNSIDSLEAIANRKHGVDIYVKTQAYVWKTGKTFFLSKKEKIVADAFIETRNFAECSRRLKVEGFEKSWLTCKRWLERSHIQEYLKEKFEEKGVYAGWSRERWVLVMTKHLQGTEKLANGDLYGMSLLAKIMGWDLPERVGMAGVSINILQQNGRP